MKIGKDRGTLAPTNEQIAKVLLPLSIGLTKCGAMTNSRQLG